MRLAGQIKLGYYPTPPSVTDLVRTWLAFPEGPFNALDPCAGEGIALAQCIEQTAAVGYGIELDPERARIARTRLTHVLTGDYRNARASIASFGLLWCNPPYDDDTAADDERTERKEHIFLRDTVHYMQQGAVLVYIIPQARLGPDTARLLSYRFERLRAFRFPDNTYSDFGQCVVMGVKRRHGAHDPEAAETLLRFAHQGYSGLTLTRRPETEGPYAVPVGRPVALFRSTVIDPAVLYEDMAESSLWARAQTITGHRRARQAGQPPVLLHRGHLALLLAAGEVDGPIGSGAARHVVRGTVLKKVDSTEEEDEEGNVTIREVERLQVVIRTIGPDGTIRTLE